MNQKGFATLEIILMVVVLGILATIAMPRFTDVTTKANTAKIQADLAALNSAMAVYEMEKGSFPSGFSFSTLVDEKYLVAEPTVPTSGKFYIKTSTSAVSVEGLSYTPDTTKSQAKFGTYYIGDIGKSASSGS